MQIYRKIRTVILKKGAALFISALVLLTACENTDTPKPAESFPVLHPEIVVNDNESVVPDIAEPADTDVFQGHIQDGGFILTDCTSHEETIRIPEAIDGTPVVMIGSSAFHESTVKHLVLPDSVVTIGDFAFLSAQSLETIELGNGLKTVGRQAFSGCRKLQTVSFPESLESLDLAFFLCNTLENVYIPGSAARVKGIADKETCPNIVIVTPKGSSAEAESLNRGLTVVNCD